MAHYNRAHHIETLAEAYGTKAIPHYPLHPALGRSALTFDQYYAMGRVAEELAQPLLALHFPSPEYLIKNHCDVDVETRKIGKSIVYNGQRIALPDYEICCANHKKWRGVYIDIKSKQSHSYRRMSGQLEQFVDQQELDGYLTLANFEQKDCWILFHLWPSQLMHSFGKAEAPRYDAGNGYVIPQGLLDALTEMYPVNDMYYQIRAQDMRRHGELREMKYLTRTSAMGYFTEIRHMTQRSGAETRLWMAQRSPP